MSYSWKARKDIFSQESLYRLGIYDKINVEKQKLKTEHHLTNRESCAVCYIWNSMVLRTEMISKGHHCLIHDVISIISKTARAPLTDLKNK